MKLRGARGAVLLAALLATGCGSASRRARGLDPSTLPVSVQADYAVFAVRCSKCHALSRPLDSGIDADHWPMYVAKMRRQPSSGISEEDVVSILRFLRYYSVEQRRLKDPP